MFACLLIALIKIFYFWDSFSGVQCGKLTSFTFLGTEKESKIQHLYYDPKAFKYFHYIYSLIDDCRSRVETATKLTVSEIPSLSDVIVKITFIQDVTDENLDIVTRKKGNMLR